MCVCLRRCFVTMSHARCNKEQIAVHLYVAGMCVCVCVCYTTLVTLKVFYIPVNAAAKQSRHVSHAQTHGHTHTHPSVLCYERLNETKKLQRCKKHTTLWTSHWARMCSVSLHASAFPLLLPCFSPLSFSTCLLSSPLIHYLTPSLPHSHHASLSVRSLWQRGSNDVTSSCPPSATVSIWCRLCISLLRLALRYRGAKCTI